MTLSDFFTEHSKLALAFSGGVDSAYLLYAARQHGANVKAYYVRTAFQPRFEYEDACRLADTVGAPMRVIELDILCDPVIASNPPGRCYHCKKKLFSAIIRAAKEDGYPLLIDGTNASDDASDRPGMRALQELSVLSPLRLCGLTKQQVRSLSREVGLFTWNKDAYACLATRIPTGTPILSEDLQRTELAEDSLRQLGFSDFRVRLMGKTARLQVPASQLEAVLEHRQAILSYLKQHYQGVVLDLEVRNEQ